MREDGSGAWDPDAGLEPLVLAIDDDPAMLAALRRMLRDLPLRLLCLRSAEEALEVIADRVPAAILSDHRLPCRSGLELLLEVRSRWPDVRTLLHTGDAEARERAARLRVPAVEKGVPPETLRATVCELLGGPGRG